MQLRSKHLAKLLLAITTLLPWQSPALAQRQHYGASRYAHIVSAVEDSAGNYLLLNLQSRTFLAAPSIQFLPGDGSHAVMVADFQGVVWGAGPRLMHPPNAQIQSVRLGQFQDSPPIFRVSITASNQAALKSLEFRCQSKSMVIKYPDAQTDLSSSSAANSAATARAQNAVSGAAKGVSAAAKSSPALANAVLSAGTPQFQSSPAQQYSQGGARYQNNGAAGSSALTNYGRQQASGTNRDAASVLNCADLVPAAKNSSSKTKSINVENPPFKTGGLFLELGPDPASPRALALAPGNTGSMPAAAPALRTQTLEEKMPPAAPEIVHSETSEKQDEPSGHKGLGSRLKHLFHKAEALVAASEDSSDEKNAGSATGGDGIVSGATPSELNPKVEFAGKDPFKIKLKFDGQLRYKTFRLDDPPRYVIDAEVADAHFNSNNDPDPNPWLKSLRIGQIESNKERIVLDLAQSHVQIKDELDGTAKTLTLTLEADTSARTTSWKGREVVLDAGHGGSDPGAQRGDIQEKDITLAITQKLKRYLEARGVKVVMTRSDDTFVSLEDRTKITNQMHPDAFVSIHINSLETDRDITGIETYYQTDQSRALADKVHAQLVEHLQVPDRSIRKARFYVVRNTDRPAILAEVGFISNKDERDKLISSDYQAKIAESVGQGVILYLGNGGASTNSVVSAVSGDDSSLRKQPGKIARPALASKGQSAVKQ
jgi:N-acetylmuramoyl-L-alanine amidase CwlD